MLNIISIILKTNLLPEFSKLWIYDSFWNNLGIKVQFLNLFEGELFVEMW